jgi:hypothetical protein
MQKKLYFLNEEEKNRILNLHESATKKQYLLGEQDEGCPNSLTMNVVEDYINQLSQTFKYMEQLFVRGYYQRERAELIYRTIKDLSDKNVFDAVNNVCVNALQYTKDNFSRFDQVGRFASYGKTLEQYLNTYTKKGSFNDKPEIQRYLNGALEFVNKIGSNKTIQQTTPSPTTPSPTTPQQSKETGGLMKGVVSSQRKKLFSNYPCVVNNPNKKETKTKSGDFVIIINGFQYYGNGRRMELISKQMSNYYCIDENTIGEGSPQVVGGQANVEPKQQSSGIGVVTRNVQNEIPILLKQAGLEGQPINQDTINKLYDILSKK